MACLNLPIGDKSEACYFNRRPPTKEEMCQLAASTDGHFSQHVAKHQVAVMAQEHASVATALTSERMASWSYVRKSSGQTKREFIQAAVKALEKALVRVGVAVRTISKMKKLGGVASQLLASANLNNVYGQYAERRRRS